MIARLGGLALGQMARRRRRALEDVWRQAAAVQERTLLRLVARARTTEFGRVHGFEAIRSVADYQARVPVQEYLDFRPRWARALDGAADLTWPGSPRYWVKTSGTTAGDKVIPVTAEALASHRKGGLDALLIAAERAGGSRLLGGPMLFLGGTTALRPIGRGGLVGDLSGLAVRRLPPLLRGRYAPGRAIASMPGWERRLAAIAAQAAQQDVRLLAGMPSWMLILLDAVLDSRRWQGRSVPDLAACWPDLGVFIHGGVAFEPYRATFEARVGRPVERVEVYPASEGFVGIATERSGGLTLMLDYDIFHEFVPVEDLGRERPRRHTVADVELGRPYAIALTTAAGLWSYLLGDTVRFTARDPLRLEITGRTRHFVNAFGENVIVDEVERALAAACHRTGAAVHEFTVAPSYPSAGEARGGHDWLVEFRRRPASVDGFVEALDEVLSRLNTDYRTKRHDDVGMRAPVLVDLPEGTFERWMRAADRLGDQHKVPRVTNDRKVAESLLCAAGTPARELAGIAS